MSRFIIYDGRNDIKAPETNHTAAAVSCNQVANLSHNSMTLRKNGREDWSLFFCESGRMYFEDRVLQAGEAWIYEPQVPQKYTVLVQDSTSYRYLHFVGTDIGHILTSLGIPCRTPITPVNGVSAELFEKIKMNLLNNDVVSAVRSECLILSLFIQLSDVRPQRTDARLVKHVTDTMAHSFSEKYDPGKYAEMLHVSVSRFNHVFKETLGIPPHQYYTGLRIENACRLLKDTDLKINEIAEYSGYSDSFYFTQAFRKQKGMTPSCYRKMNRKLFD